MKRMSFVIQVHVDGIVTLENVQTLERVAVRELGDVVPHVKRWLATPGTGSPKQGRAAVTLSEGAVVSPR